MNMQPLIEAVKAHALANYTTGGWDNVVECWTDEDIFEVLGQAGVTTAEEAIAEVGQAVGFLADIAADVVGHGGCDFDDHGEALAAELNREPTCADPAMHAKFVDRGIEDQCPHCQITLDRVS